MKDISVSRKILVQNKKASFNYYLSDFLECGIELQGSEIKSIRLGGCSINDSYIVIKNNEAYILNMNIAPYDKAVSFGHGTNVLWVWRSSLPKEAKILLLRLGQLLLIMTTKLFQLVTMECLDI